MKSFAIGYEWEEGEERAFSKDGLEKIELALEGIVETDVVLFFEVTIASQEEIRRLNRETRNIDKVTDVLSYPALDRAVGERIEGAAYPFETDEEGRLLAGSVAICLDRAKEQAEEYGHSLERELYYLLVHGVLHCLGYDHETDADRAIMRTEEERILQKAGRSVSAAI